jgi:alkyldihydroxyacetonephosphate synthase
MELPKSAGNFLAQLLGKAKPLEDVTLASVCEQVPPSRLPEHTLINTDNEERVRHARGQSLPDWLAMRSGEFKVFPDGVAYPENAQHVQTLLSLAKAHNFELIPYGGGTSVAGHITPNASERAILTVDMGRMNQLTDLDEESCIATFGAGTPGPMVEAQLRAKGYTLGHFPQSFELSTIGGWVASRSSGQQSLRYGRIEQLFAGGSLETFTGTMDIPTFPASSAGPDMREIILGCEGRFGILTDVKVRVTKIAEEENFFVTFFPDWEAAKSFCRDAAQQRIPLSMLRVSNAVETQTQLKLAGHATVIALLERYLKMRGCGEQKCMLTFGITGSKSQNRSTSRQIGRLSRQYKGVNTGTKLGKRWQGNRFKLPYLREALWLKGYAIDTLETSTDWKNVNLLQDKVEASLRDGLADENEPVHVFTHLSHVYSQGCSLYTSYLYRCADSYEQTHTRWKKLKTAASETIANNQGTISHQHGVGKDHAPYLAVEKGEQGMAVLSTLCNHFDGDKQLNPGTLIKD